ncbi:hypothetical protein I4U23_022929 [Adineta vaga]|nr:hypothetical protein I4U23_022929 [Adineta vaga]
MNKLQSITTFECFPNEIIIECFEYFHGLEIFYSFDDLNSRFNKLIRTIQLNMNFEYVRKIIFDKFCQTMQSNPETKKQISSLKLSNKNTCGQIQHFLSLFSFNEFTSLRSLTLIEVEENNIDQLKTMLPLLSTSCLIHLIDSDSENHGEPLLLGTNIHKTCPSLPTFHCPLIFSMSCITHLTLGYCSCLDLSQLFRYLSMLRYVNVGYVSSNKSWTEYYTEFSNDRAVHLTQLILMNFSAGLTIFERLAKQIQNLNKLMIISNGCIDMFDASRWENLIVSSLPLLTIFKFEFNFKSKYDWIEKTMTVFTEKFEYFQTSFWREEHHWFTEFSCNSNRSILFYTIPYMSHVAFLNELPEKLNTFDHITELTVDLQHDMRKDEFYFENVRKLKLYTRKQDEIIIGIEESFQSLKMMINLSKLRYLHIIDCSTINFPIVLLNILKEASQLSSLKLYPKFLLLSFSNDELSKYLNSKIKELDLYLHSSSTLFTNDDITKTFCRIFSNLEQLSCKMEEQRYLIVLLNHLSKLSMAHVSFSNPDFLVSSKVPIDLQSFQKETSKINMLFRISHTECVDNTEYFSMFSQTIMLTIWIDNNI